MPASRHPYHHGSGAIFHDSAEAGLGTGTVEHDELVHHQIMPIDDNLPASEQIVDNFARHVDVCDTAIRLVHLNRVAPVVLNGDTELRPFDPQSRISGHENRSGPLIDEVLRHVARIR